ncbi:hypothetical protein D9619_004300 [Psilocybe cf. subviscida]|uniref:Fungal lipase-type domain-containing protein n=1 Tax=Psilocybe cf. subviscida TaxID=2480587 RepID=A0A8H5BR38_9AGAR|nr:hypothetical protein D9619_004300 [Psilocybe cf. subviscida]
MQLSSPVTDIQGLIVRDDTKKEVVVALRGSLSVTDVIIDSQVLLVPFASPGVKLPSGTRVHSGFLFAWDSVALQVVATVKSVLEKHPNYSIVTTGHSLGGSLALLAAISLQQNFSTIPIRTYSYGAPRTGNKIFSDYVNATLGEKAHRVVHGNDGVPTIIPVSLGYHHHGVEYWQYTHPASESTTKKCNAEGEDATCSASVPSQGVNLAHTSKRIFADITLSDGVSSQNDITSMHRLGHLLERKPQLADYIRTLKYKHYINSDMADASIFHHLRFVTTFHLGFRVTADTYITASWSATTPSFRNALFSFLSSNHIARLTLDHIDHVPRTIFGHLPGLLWLTADWVTLDTSEAMAQSQVPAPKLRSLLTERGGRTFVMALLLPQLRSSIDFSLLEVFKMSLDYIQPDMGVIIGIIRQSHRLKSIYIDGNPPFLDMRNTLSSCLHAESLRSLKSINLDIEIDNEEQDPYCHLSSELAKISRTNVLEEIELSICIVFDTQCTTELRHWVHLDEVLSQNGGFTSLQRVNIDVEICHFSSDPKELESKMLFIRDNAFSALSRWDQIEFGMTVETCFI